MGDHMHSTQAAPSQGVASILRAKRPLDQALPGSMVALLSQPLLGNWYNDADPAERQIKRTGLLWTRLKEVWQSMGWTMTQVSGLAQSIFKARLQWIDGISSARRAMEQFVHIVRGHAHGSPQFDAMIEAQLRRPLYTQCLG